MSSLTLLVVAVGVSADAFAVAVAKGLHLRRLTLRDTGSLVLAFGLAQALMPLAGWALARGFRGYITEVDHWVAFGLLALIGAKMIHEAVSPDEEEDRDRIGLRELVVLALATSVDALAVGISFAFLDVSIVPAVVLIGVVTAVATLVGVRLGRRAGGRFGKPAEIAGGVILILIGTRILLDHLGVL